MSVVHFYSYSDKKDGNPFEVTINVLNHQVTGYYF